MRATSGNKDNGLIFCFLTADWTAASALRRNGTLLSSIVIGSTSFVRSVSSPPWVLASEDVGCVGLDCETWKTSKLADASLHTGNDTTTQAQDSNSRQFAGHRQPRITAISHT